MPKAALVTGGSSGIGRAAAEALARRGFRVYEISRHEQKPEDENKAVWHITGDVTDDDSLKRAIDLIMAREERLDVVVNNAGFGISGGVEFTETEDARRLMDVNFFGMVRVNKLVLPLMRKAGGGRLIQVSSVAAAAPIPFQTFYSASKAAVSAYSLALANEVRPYGISVCCLLPGDIRTGFTAAREKSPVGDDCYGGRIGRSVARMEKDEQTGMDPRRLGNLIARLATRRRVRPFYTCGAFYHLVTFLCKLLPASLVNRVLGLLYGG